MPQADQDRRRQPGWSRGPRESPGPSTGSRIWISHSHAGRRVGVTRSPPHLVCGSVSPNVLPSPVVGSLCGPARPAQHPTLPLEGPGKLCGGPRVTGTPSYLVSVSDTAAGTGVGLTCRPAGEGEGRTCLSLKAWPGRYLYPFQSLPLARNWAQGRAGWGLGPCSGPQSPAPIRASAATQGPWGTNSSGLCLGWCSA